MTNEKKYIDFVSYPGSGAAAADQIDLLGELVKSSSVKTIKISNAGFAVVDADDYERIKHLKLFVDTRQPRKIVHALEPTDGHYHFRKKAGKSTQLGRIILGLAAGDRRSVQYLNGNNSDLRKSNLSLKLTWGRPVGPEASLIYFFHDPKKRFPWQVVFFKSSRGRSSLGYYATKEQAARIASIAKGDIRRAQDAGDDIYSVENQKRLRYAAYEYAVENFPQNTYSIPRGKSRTAPRESVGLERRPAFPSWSEADREILKALYPETPTEHLCLLLGRSKSVIEITANQMGFKRSRDFIRRVRTRAHYRTNYPPELVETAQTLGELKRLIRERKTGCWTDDSINSFKRLYPDASSAELAAFFQCPIAAIQSMAVRLRLGKSEEYRRKRWCMRKPSLLADPNTTHIEEHMSCQKIKSTI